MTLSMSFMVSYILTMLTMLSEIIVPFGYTDDDASAFGFWITLIGNLGGVTAAFIIGRTGHYKYTTVGLTILTIIGTIVFQFCVRCISPAHGYWPVFISLIFVCFMNMGVQSYCMEYAVKLAPDIGESLSGGTIIQTFNLFGYVQLRLVEVFTKGVKNKKDILHSVMVSNYVVLAAALAIIFFVKNDSDEDLVSTTHSEEASEQYEAVKDAQEQEEDTV